MTQPTLYLEATFGSGPAGGPWMTLDDRVRGILDTDKLADDTLGSGFWTDLVAAEGVPEVRTQKGRQRLLQSPEAGTLTARINNNTRHLDPTNTAGPYVAAGASLVKPMRPVRLRADWGYAYIDLPNNSAADYISTPDSATLTTTDLYLEWTGSAKWANTGNDTLAAKYGAAGQRSWRLRRVSQSLEFTWSTDGTATTVETLSYTPSTGFYYNDQILSIYVMLDVVSASSPANYNYQLRVSDGFLLPVYYSDSYGNAAAATSVFDSTTAITLGQDNGSNPIKGRIYRFAQYDRIPADANNFTDTSGEGRGRYVALFDAKWGVAGSSTVVSHPTNETWTINGSAALAGSTTNYQLWQGYADEWANVWEDKTVGFCQLSATDGFKVLSRVDNNAGSPVGGGEFTGTRIGRLLDSASWGSGDRDLDTGQTTVQATTLAQNVLTELFLTADTERGDVFVSGDGKFTFRDRTYRYVNNRSKQRSWLVGDALDGIELPYADLVMSGDDDLIVNQISVARVGGTAQTTSDATSIANYLTRTFTRTDLIHQTDTESANYAAIVLAEFKDQDLRFDALTVNPAMTDRLWPLVLDGRIGDRMTVRRRPPGGGATIERDCFIEGVAHDIVPGNGGWTTTFQLSDASRWGGFVLDDSTLGVLDTNRLGY